MSSSRNAFNEKFCIQNFPDKAFDMNFKTRNIHAMKFRNAIIMILKEFRNLSKNFMNI